MAHVVPAGRRAGQGRAGRTPRDRPQPGPGHLRRLPRTGPRRPGRALHSRRHRPRHRRPHEGTAPEPRGGTLRDLPRLRHPPDPGRPRPGRPPHPPRLPPRRMRRFGSPRGVREWLPL
ncbi:hypothetical protein E1285_34390 [Actinomadura sp. 7K507]|nr:hypothetical protein E1285_34390 [Actinomadura sp. 7K507]